MSEAGRGRSGAVPHGPDQAGSFAAAVFGRTRSGLLIPAGIASPGPPSFPDQMKVFLTGSEMTGMPPARFAAAFPPTTIDGHLAGVGLETVAVNIAAILQHLHNDRTDSRRTDRELAARLLPPALAQRATTILDSDPRRCFLAPHILLTVLQRACAVGTDEPLPASAEPVMPVEPLLALAEYLETDALDDDLASSHDDPGHVVRLVIASQVFHAIPDIQHLVARFRRRWLPQAPDAADCDLASLFEQATDVALTDWITVGIALYSSLQNLQNPPILDTSVFTSMGWEPARFEAILALVSADAPQLRAAVAQDVERHGREWAFGAFERYPVLRLARGDLVLLDPHLIARRFFGWLPLFDLMQGLRDRDPEHGQRDAGRAETCMRRRSEHYALDVLSATVAAPRTGRLYDETALKAAYAGKKSSPRIADAAIDYGAAWIVVEVTTSQLTRHSAAGTSDRHLMHDLDKLVKKVEQIDSTITLLRENEAKLTGTTRRPPQRRGYHPLLVVTEGFPVSPFTLRLLREKAREKQLLTGDDIAPLEVVDLVELEMIEALSETDGRSIAGLLADKRTASLRESSLRDFIVLELHLQPGIPRRLEPLWDAMFDVVTDTLGIDPPPAPSPFSPRTPDGSPSPSTTACRTCRKPDSASSTSSCP